MGESKLIEHYTLAESMYGRTTYPKKGKIDLNEDTSQKDLSYLHNEVGMVDCISMSEMTKKQIDLLAAKKIQRKKEREEFQAHVAKESEKGKMKKDK